jgi:hypothetical protein
MSQLFKLFLAAALLFSGLSVFTGQAYACSCMIPPPPQEALQGSSAVFAGKVVGIEAPQGAMISSADPVAVKFEVSQVWKGPQEATIVITTPRDSASCGFEFTQGGEYIVYAWDGERGLETGLCSRTNSLANAQEDLAAFGQGYTPPQAAPEQEASPMILWLAVAGVLVVGAGLIAVGVFFKPGRRS